MWQVNINISDEHIDFFRFAILPVNEVVFAKLDMALALQHPVHVDLGSRKALDVNLALKVVALPAAQDHLVQL